MPNPTPEALVAAHAAYDEARESGCHERDAMEAAVEAALAASKAEAAGWEAVATLNNALCVAFPDDPLAACRAHAAVLPLIAALSAPQPPAETQADEVVCLECGQPTMHMGQVCYACSHPAEAQPVRGLRVVTLSDAWDYACGRLSWNDLDARAVRHESAPVGVEEMQRRLDREESDHGWTIDQRDAAEDALGRMFQAVTGRPAEWSSVWGYVDAIEEVEEHIAALAQQPAASMRCDDCHEPTGPRAVCETCAGIRCDAVSQQPAAVDEAMVERALAAYLRRQEDGESLYGCVTAALTAALAPQPQEPTT
ncbi:MAG: hypothetical protein GX856_07195 [Gammaproteobacteria bacterium]|nr:hypothetical protein [Gammaproteobacteria bacterium]